MQQPQSGHPLSGLIRTPGNAISLGISLRGLVFYDARSNTLLLSTELATICK